MNSLSPSPEHSQSNGCYRKFDGFVKSRITEDTPHFLNSEVLQEEDAAAVKDEDEAPVAYDQEEPERAEAEAGPAPAEDASGGNILAQQPPEKIENVLNSGRGCRFTGQRRLCEKVFTLNRMDRSAGLRFGPHV